MFYLTPGRLKTPTTKDIPASDRAKWRLRFGGWAHLRRENWLRINHSINQPFKFDLGLTVGRDRLFTSPFCCCCCCRPVRYRVCAGFEFKSISSFFPYVNMQPSISGWACVEKWLKIRIQTVKRLVFLPYFLSLMSSPASTSSRSRPSCPGDERVC